MPKILNLGPHRHWIDKLAELNGLVTGVALYPQVWKALTSVVETQQLSFTSFFLIFLNSIIWIAYGVHRGLIPLVIASSLNSLAALILVILASIGF